MAAAAAYNGTFKISPSTVIHDVNSYELQSKLDLIETTALSASTPGTKSFIPGLIGMTIPVSTNFNKGDTGWAALESAHFGKTTVTIIASPNGSNTYTFTAWVGEYTAKVDVASKIAADFVLTMDGGCTLA